MLQIKREMGCTPEDLVRWLPMALGDLFLHTSFEMDGKTLLQAVNPLMLITGTSKPERTIALLKIPVLDLNLTFADSLMKSQCEEALNRFDLYTRRGGG